jgi:hypothetical protein
MSAPAPQDEAPPAPIPTFWKVIGWVALVLPILGIAAHVTLLGMARDSDQWTRWVVDYRRSSFVWVVSTVACVNLAASWFHYRRTGSPVSVVSRILTYLWIISLVFIWQVPAAATA